MAEQRRRSFDEVLNDQIVQWSKRFERALEEQRQVIGKEAEERTADIGRSTHESLEALEQMAAEKTAELEQIAVDYREANERAVGARAAEVELATRQQVDASVAEVANAYDEFADKRLHELEDTLRAKLEGFRRELIDETHRVREANAEQLNETRTLVRGETRRLEEQGAAAQDELRRLAVKESAAFDELARERVSELRDLLRNQTNLLSEFTGMHESTSAQLDEVREFTTEAMARLSSLNDAVARQIGENEEATAAAAQRLKQTSATELNSIQQRAMALDELARKHIADVERAAGELLEAETSTAEGLREFERQLEDRRAEVEALVDDRTNAISQHVREAEAALTQRITERGAHAESTVDDLRRDLEATGAAMKSELRDGRRADASLARAMDEKIAQLVELMAAAQVALDQVASRVEALEEIAGAAPPEIHATQPAELEDPARRGPSQEAANTPDLREW